MEKIEKIESIIDRDGDLNWGQEHTDVIQIIPSWCWHNEHIQLTRMATGTSRDDSWFFGLNQDLNLRTFTHFLLAVAMQTLHEIPDLQVALLSPPPRLIFCDNTTPGSERRNRWCSLSPSVQLNSLMISWEEQEQESPDLCQVHKDFCHFSTFLCKLNTTVVLVSEA